MTIRCSYEGKSRRLEFPGNTILIGRVTPTSSPNLDLSGDPSVSRIHARIWIDRAAYWIEDRNSSHGTYVNGQKIETPWKLHPGDTIMVGDTAITVEMVALKPPEEESPKKEEEHFNFPTQMDARSQSSSVKIADSSVLERDQLGFLLDLPLQLAQITDLAALMQHIVERLVSVLRGAKRGALMLMEGEENPKLELRGCVPRGAESPISHTLAQRTLESGQAFIWNKTTGPGDLSNSIVKLKIQAGMYAPLVWNNAVLGVICVDNPGSGAGFSPDDLRLLIAVGQYSAAAIANRRMQETLTFNAMVLDRLLTSFSPKVRTQLLSRARAGQLQPGGEESEVTILMSDVRGFTALSQAMETSQVVAMLNDYFSALVEVVFAYDGTIDKFLGDGMLVIFGSPERDPQQYQKAVRAGLAIQARVAEVSQQRVRRGAPACVMGIGVHCGTVLHGFIGAAERLEFTVIGNAVNRAARFCSGAKGGQVLISPEMRAHVGDEFRLESTKIATKHEGDWEAFNVMPDAGGPA